MSDFNAFKTWLSNFGLDVKSFCTLTFACVTLIWSVSVKYSAFTDHMTQIDRTQIELKDSMRRQDEQWDAALKANSAAIVESLKQMNAQSALERNNLATRMATIESWRLEEEKRDVAEETSIARIGEQIAATHSDVTDLKTLLENVLVKGVVNHVQ